MLCCAHGKQASAIKLADVRGTLSATLNDPHGLLFPALARRV
jgi:hypothetical protein